MPSLKKNSGKNLPGKRKSEHFTKALQNIKVILAHEARISLSCTRFLYFVVFLTARKFGNKNICPQ